MTLPRAPLAAAVDDAGSTWWRRQRVCLTGGSGLIGRHVIERLRALEAARIVSVDRSKEMTRDGVEHRQGSILDRAVLRHALAGCTVVFHLAAEKRGSGARVFETNATGTGIVMRAAAEAGVATVVFTSTAYVYGRAQHLPIREDHPTQPVSDYARSKLEGERAVEALANLEGLSAVMARLANVYASSAGSDTVVGLALRQVPGGRIVLRDHRPVRDFLHIADAAEALVRLPPAARAGCHAVNVSTGAGTSIAELARSIADAAAILGHDVDVAPPQPGPPDPVPDLVLDNRRLRELTGWAPQVSLKQGLFQALAGRQEACGS